MNSVLVNLRVYKVIFPDGKQQLAIKDHDDRGGGGTDTYDDAALIVRDIFEKESQKHPGGFLFSINFTPFHDIEWPSGMIPKRCLPLTPDEQKYFWEHFVSIQMGY